MADLLDCCRLCLGRTDAEVDIFLAEMDNKSYAKILQDTLQIELLPVDGLSPKACDECIRAITVLKGFRSTILTSQGELEKRFLDMNMKKDEYVEDASVYDDVEVIDITAEDYGEMAEEDVSEATTAPVIPLPLFSRKANTVKRHYQSHQAAAPKPLFPKRTIVRPSKEPRIYSCETCGKVLGSASILKHHYLTHLPPEQRVAKFVCEICGKGYDIRGQLTAHSYTHRERRTVKCDQCGLFVFNLQRHINYLHTDKYAGTCTICNIEFKYLSGHMSKVHSEKTSVNCSVCGKEFKTKKDLERHKSVHTGDRVTCLFCDHTSTGKDNTRNHMRKKHPEEYQEYLKQNQSKMYQERVKEGV